MQLPTQLPTRLPTRLNTIEDYYLATGGGGRLQPETRQAIQRVQAGGGVVEDPQWLNQIITYWKSRGKWENFVLLCGRGLGETIRVSGSDRFVSRLWDASAYQGDYAQATEASQGLISGNKLDVSSGQFYRPEKLAALTGASSVEGIAVVTTLSGRSANANLLWYCTSSGGDSRFFEVRQNSTDSVITFAINAAGTGTVNSGSITSPVGDQILFGSASQSEGTAIRDATGLSQTNASVMGTIPDLLNGRGGLFAVFNGTDPWNSTARICAYLRDTTLTADDRAGFIALCRAKYGDIVTAP
jgi:hypothetical protein